MKKILLIFFLALMPTAWAQIAFNTGSVELDTDLNNINVSAKLNFSAFRSDLCSSYRVTEKNVDYLHVQLKMAPAEIYLALEIARIAKRPYEEVLLVYKSHKKKGWGYIAKECGIKPGSPEFHQLKKDTNYKKSHHKGHSSKGKGKKA